jgi:hypothetical protein
MFGERNDGRASFMFEVTDKKTGRQFTHPKSGISRLDAYNDFKKEKGRSWEIKWA